MSSPSPVPSPTGFVVKNGSNIRADRVRDPPTVVGDLDAHPRALAAGAQRDPPRAADSVDRVGEQVRPDLVELGPGGLDRRQVGVELADHVDAAVAQALVEQRQRASRPSWTSTAWRSPWSRYV